MDACSLCCNESQSWAVGPCEHATCLVCSVRLRVLCDQRDCPVCREKLNKVVVSDSIKSFSLPPHGSKVDRKYGYHFHTTQLYDQYKSLTAYCCSKCRDKSTFGSFALLRDHMRKTHGLVYCDICCENLKLFPYELRQYSRQELTRHRREGDPDATSYKGHPLCQFCDYRFFDNDALHSHLRKVHFWCHFCESDGKQDYYATYLLLRNHFRAQHYLCVEGACQQEKFTSVFRTKLDLQVHRAKAHSRGVTKAEAKQMRQLNVEFSYGRAEDRGGGGGVYVAASGGRGQWQNVPQRGRHNKTRDKDYEDKASGAAPTSASIQSKPQQQQRDSKSPPNTGNSRKQRTPDAGGQYMSEQPPRMKQRQQHQTPRLQPSTTTSTPSTETLSNTTGNPSDSKTSTVASKTAATKKTAAGASQAKKPPGFESSQPTKSPTMNTDSASEWPDLLALNISPPEDDSKQAPTPKIQPPRGSYNPLEPSNFPPLSFSIVSTANNNYATSAPPAQRSRASLSAAVASNIPPGFVSPQWQLIQQDSIYKSPSSSNLPVQGTAGSVGSGALQQGVTEGSVISMVREALGNDRERFNYFRNLSGWYRNSEITVQEYVLRCRELFGDYQWMLIGQKLAQVMPIECKRNELLLNVYAGMTQLQHPSVSPSEYHNQLPPSAQLVLMNTSSTATPPPIHVSRSEPTLLQTSRAAKWGIITNRGVPNWESELEYPTLHPGGSSAGPGHGWIKARVPPV
ncbi:E3 ubiquitin-protein ligase ZNF598 [Geodia barretti]|uniref:RING-type E3 ubiquitin transferase n=1 Tax=Geodia barretti TaxID=519541 RepID=A0AA35S1A5_GEOBA|nr:E3 ubiquitin-protein ligase ZNF598 [Geodia barretti]